MEKDMDVKKVPFTTSINPDVLKKFKVYCAVNGLYQNQVIENLIVELLKKDKKDEQNE